MIKLLRLHLSESLLKGRELYWEKNGIFNPGVTTFNNQILLLYRAVGEDNVSRFGVALSSDGVRFNFVSEAPAFIPDPTSGYETYGVEDPRISYFDNKYWIIYIAVAENKTELRPEATDWKTRISLCWTQDFESFERKGVIIHSYNDKDACLIPKKWGDYFYLYHRRHPSIWLSKSIDLNTWEDVCSDTCIVISPDGQAWDNDRIGIGSQPILTGLGWLVFYHGRDKNGVYRLGVFLADLNNPDKVISKLPYPILEPELPFEKVGKTPSVVFTCGAVEAGGYYLVYYGGADFQIGGAYIKKVELLDELKKYMGK